MPTLKQNFLVAISILSFFQVSISIAQTPWMLDVVNITATRQQQHQSESLADVSVIGPEAIAQAGPITSLGELLAKEAGIEFVQSGGNMQSSSVYIRGSNANHVLLLIDGMRVGSLTLGAASWEYIPLEQIDHIEVIRGPASNLYGSDAIAGVVQVFTHQAKEAWHVQAQAGLGSFNTHAYSSGFSMSEEHWRYSFQGSDKSSSSISAIDNPNNPSFNPDRDGYHASSALANVSYRFNSEHEVGLKSLFSQGWNRFDGGGYSTPASDDYKQSQNVSSLSLVSRDVINEFWTSGLQIGQSMDNNLQFDNALESSQFKTIQNQYQWQNDLKWSQHRILLALERLDQHVLSSSAYSVSQRTIDSFTAGWSMNAGANRWQLNFRNDANSQFGQKSTALMAYGRQFDANWRLSGSIASAYKAPSFNDLYYPVDAYGDVGNPNLKPESALNEELALRFDSDVLQTSLTHYHNRVKDLIQWAPVDPSFTQSYGYMPSNVASATLEGWTLSYVRHFNATHLAASYDLQDPRDDLTQKTLVNRARKIAKLSLDHRWKAWSGGLELKVISKRYSDADNTQELAAYSLLNLHAKLSLSKNWSLMGRLNNALNKRYESIQDYASPGVNFYLGIRYATP